MKIKKGDKVKVITGKDKGKTGKVLAVNIEKDKVTVEGLNLLHKNKRPKKQGEKGQRIQFPAALKLSNVILVCPKCAKPTRVAYKIENKTKTRFCKKCKEII